MLGHHQKMLVKRKNPAVCLFSATTWLGQAWYFVAVMPEKYQACMDALKQGNVEFGKYGVILEKGFGGRPPEEIIHKMTQEYGFAPSANAS
ncbi:hypothetical protein GC177_02875 [bacterium]|nr:hypothetical protein [bacterium]